MKMTSALIPTLKEDPAEAEVISHKLMIRAGLIRKLGAGAYIYLPLGYRVLKKVEDVIRDEMDKAGALELLLPAMHPRELWEKTGRYSLLGEILITYKDRHGRDYLLGPTHEEVITDLVAREIRSYRNLPKTLYQIQTKFRDEPRPRFGVLRSKEFIMKDAYSFDADQAGLNRSYQSMYDAYRRIFDRCGLRYIAVEADTGFMGGDVSHEFMVPAGSGEDIIAVCGSCGYAASREVCGCQDVMVNDKSKKPAKLKKVETPGVSTVEKVSEFLGVKPISLVKTLLYKADGNPIAVLIRGDRTLNETKLTKYLSCGKLEMCDEKSIEEITGGPLGFSGPVDLKGVRIIADYVIRDMENFVAGANEKDMHYINVNLQRDFKVSEWADLRYVEEKDACPKCKKGTIKLKTSIEVGHTFKLGTKYSKALGANFLDSDGKEKPCIMGCYGIGVNRIIASCIEQNNDKDGIIWPLEIAPYKVIILPLNMAHKETTDIANRLYDKLTASGIEVLLDDRQESAGIKFKDADLIGVPIQVIIGEKALKQSKLELKQRRNKEVTLVEEKDVADTIRGLL
ncbi:MAG: proline--tRNA ligase [Candidatus Omnitrophica bacterium]|nr:proline--tRNA ligase [Candidatus Omnitrophota bacterium]